MEKKWTHGFHVVDGRNGGGFSRDVARPNDLANSVLQREFQLNVGSRPTRRNRDEMERYAG
jgi:hypothetical protein